MISAPDRWYPLTTHGENLITMVRHNTSGCLYAPMYIHIFPLHHTNAVETMPAFTHCSDKIRWLRQQHNLSMKEVADFIGIYGSTYRNYENSQRDYYPIPVMTKLAEFYQLPVEELLDEYNHFLQGQRQLLKDHRNHLNMTQKQFAQSLNIPLPQLKKWERGTARVSKESWQSHFQNNKQQ